MSTLRAPELPRALPQALRGLRERPVPKSGVLSAYLDLSPGRVAGEAYLLELRDRFKALRAQLPATALDAFEAAAARVERYLAEMPLPGQPGLALFAANGDYCYAVALPFAPTEQASWGERPLLVPLEEALDDYERVAVLLFDKERARLLTVFLGQVEAERALEDEVPGKQATGEWFALAQTRYARHREDHVLRHAKRAIGLLMETLRARPFDRLLVAGPDEAISLLTQHLPRPLRARLAGRLELELFAPTDAVLKAALAAAEAIERRREVEDLDTLLEAAGGPRAVLGTATLGALDDGRVHRLLMAETYAAVGGECRGCGRLVPGVASCGACGDEAGPLRALREAAVARARAQGARVDVLSGDAAALLMAHGGIGGWVRY